MKRACAHTRNGSLSPLVYEPIDERKRLIGRQRPTGCTGSLGILRYPDERFILSLLHSRHLLRGVRTIFELPFSPCLSISVPLSLYLRISLLCESPSPILQAGQVPCILASKGVQAFLDGSRSTHVYLRGLALRVSPPTPLSRADGYACTCLDV